MEIETKYYVNHSNEKSFTKEELMNEKLSRNTLVWSKDMKKWKKLKNVPELIEVVNAIPPEKKTLFPLKIISSLLLLTLIIGAGYWGYLNKDRFFNKEAVLKPISSDSLYVRYSNSIVLIKHSYLYKIKIGKNEFYFRDYDPQTGKTNEFKSFEELKETPNESWGTGFFINDSGEILTCKHIINVKPSIEDQNKILSYLKNRSSKELYEIEGKLYSFQNDRNEIVRRVNIYSDYLSVYDYDKYVQEVKGLEEKIALLEVQKSAYEEIVNVVHLPQNFVTKTSTQFGIFFNDTYSKTLNDYIKCSSTNISNKYDLAIIKPNNRADINKYDFKPINLDKIKNKDSLKVNINEELRMIGYNYGINIANTSNGIKSQITKGFVSQVPNNEKILYSISALPGSSGSPVFDKYGRLVSVNFAGIINTQNFNFGISPMQINDFLFNNSATKSKH